MLPPDGRLRRRSSGSELPGMPHLRAGVFRRCRDGLLAMPCAPAGSTPRPSGSPRGRCTVSRAAARIGSSGGAAAPCTRGIPGRAPVANRSPTSDWLRFSGPALDRHHDHRERRDLADRQPRREWSPEERGWPSRAETAGRLEVARQDLLGTGLRGKPFRRGVGHSQVIQQAGLQRSPKL